MLPFDNKNEFQIVVDMPEGTTLEGTDAVIRQFEDYLRGVAEVTHFVSYVGTASPIDFNGMVRHYFLRSGPHVADIRVNLIGKDHRQQQSHEILLRIRNDVAELPRGVIHGDLFRDNVLFNERGLTGVLDFHHAARGALIYDLAVAANDWCTDSSGLTVPDRAIELLRAYHRIRPLSRSEIRLFPAFALYGALAFWLSRLAVAIERDAGRSVRTNNPEEFERIVSQHHAHFFYLDERMLST